MVLGHVSQEAGGAGGHVHGWVGHTGTSCLWMMVEKAYGLTQGLSWV